MQKQTILIAVVAFIVGGIAVTTMQYTHNREYRTWNNSEKKYNMHDGMHRMPDGSFMSNTQVATNTQQHMMHMMVRSEQAFIEGMIPHHEEAIRTAQEVLARGATTPAMKTLAENIITAQEKEVADMKAWYETWYGKTYTNTNTYTPMMRDLTSLSGVALDKVFLEDMIMHHVGAIMMAQSVQPYIEHEVLKELTRAIAVTQQAEITQMQQILTEIK